MSCSKFPLNTPDGSELSVCLASRPRKRASNPSNWQVNLKKVKANLPKVPHGIKPCQHLESTSNSKLCEVSLLTSEESSELYCQVWSNPGKKEQDCTLTSFMRCTQPERRRGMGKKNRSMVIKFEVMVSL